VLKLGLRSVTGSFGSRLRRKLRSSRLLLLPLLPRFLSYTHTHTRTHAHTQTRTHAHEGGGREGGREREGQTEREYGVLLESSGDHVW